MIDGNAQSQSLQSTALEAAVASIRSRPVELVSVKLWEDNHLVREIRSPAVRKHRIGAPCHSHHDPDRDDQPPAEDSGMAAREPGLSRPRVRGDQRGDRSRAGSVPACDTGHAGQSAELG
jgi:hypothetical protein